MYGELDLGTGPMLKRPGEVAEAALWVAFGGFQPEVGSAALVLESAVGAVPGRVDAKPRPLLRGGGRFDGTGPSDVFPERPDPKRPG